MTQRPCIVCGEPSSQSRCPEHQLQQKPRDHAAWRNLARWKNHSKRLRRLSPFCEQCDSLDSLQVDHIIPVSVCPELTYADENCRVLCKTCNGRRQNTYTDQEAQHVLDRLHASYRRRPSRGGRERIAAAERALTTQGGHPDRADAPTAGKAQRALHT